MSTTQHSVGIERLRTLYSVIAGIPTHVLSLHSWRGSANAVPDSMLMKGSECGTTACAVGWACIYPEFREEGLSWNAREGVPVFGLQWGFAAVRTFFQLDRESSITMFAGNAKGKNAKIQVLSEIRKYLLAKGVISQARSDMLRACEVADSWSLA